ncbi:uncharacterized protein JCM6883_003248 [Sporobolomyces salmoneus]|uniref:uncharacterized protein n=1 Tax=Sporobolomyces salmoneus TaxID=183962 RepID=UPI00316E3B81
MTDKSQLAVEAIQRFAVKVTKLGEELEAELNAIARGNGEIDPPGSTPALLESSTGSTSTLKGKGKAVIAKDIESGNDEEEESVAPVASTSKRVVFLSLHSVSNSSADSGSLSCFQTSEESSSDDSSDSSDSSHSSDEEAPKKKKRTSQESSSDDSFDSSDSSDSSDEEAPKKKKRTSEEPSSDVSDDSSDDSSDSSDSSSEESDSSRAEQSPPPPYSSRL